MLWVGFGLGLEGEIICIILHIDFSEVGYARITKWGACLFGTIYVLKYMVSFIKSQKNKNLIVVLN